MSRSFAGNYPLETHEAEIERLFVQGEAMAPESLRMLDLIGVGEGWRVLDIGCGPRGITDLLSRKVGRSGRVLGLDMNARFLDVAREHAGENTSFIQGDAYNSGLPASSFDLVHMRFVASTAGNPERLIGEAMRLAKPGGVVALQEPDGSTLVCHPPHPAWDRLKAALLGAFAGVGSDLELARKLYGLVYHSGLQDVQFRPFIVGVRAGDPMADYLPSTVASLRDTVLKLGLATQDELPALLQDCRRHLATPGTSFTMYTVAQVWGRKAAA